MENRSKIELDIKTVQKKIDQFIEEKLDGKVTFDTPFFLSECDFLQKLSNYANISDDQEFCELLSDIKELPLILFELERLSDGMVLFQSTEPIFFRHYTDASNTEKLSKTYTLILKPNKNTQNTEAGSPKRVFYFDKNGQINHYKIGSISSDNAQAKKDIGYYKTLEFLLKKFPDGCTDILIDKIFPKSFIAKLTNESIKNGLDKKGTGLWRTLASKSNNSVENINLTTSSKVISVNTYEDGTKITFRNLL